MFQYSLKSLLQRWFHSLTQQVSTCSLTPLPLYIFQTFCLTSESLASSRGGMLKYFANVFSHEKGLSIYIF